MSAAATLEVAVFGPTVVRGDGLPISLSPRERTVLAAFAMHHPQWVALDTIVDTIWPSAPPPSCRQVVQNNVSGLRRRFGGGAILTEAGPMYRLGGGWLLDFERFTRHIEAARRSALVNDHRGEFSHLRRALDLARGVPLHDLPSGSAVDAERTRIQQLLLTVQEDAVLAELAAGHVASATASASTLASAEPYRELRWSLLALGNYRSGDRREGLETLRRARRALRDGIGLDPGPVMVRVERMMHDDDSRLLEAPPRAVLGLDRRGEVGSEPGILRVIGGATEVDRVRSLLARSIQSDTSIWITLTSEDPAVLEAGARRIELDASLDGWSVLEGTCHLRAQRVLEPLGALARRALEQTPDPSNTIEPSVLRGVTALWEDTADVSGGPVSEPGEAAMILLEQYAQRSPTLIVVENAHHLSSASCAHLARLATQPVPLVVLAVGAPDSPVPAGAEVVRMRIGDAVDGVDATVPANDHRRSVKAVDDASAFGPRGVVEVATLIAVAGAPLSFEILRGTGRPPDDLRQELASGVELGLLRPVRDGGFDVVGSAARSSLVDELDGGTREDIHRSLALSMLEHGQVFAAAPHLLLSSERPELVVDNVAAAARRALNAGMFVEAAALFDHATQRHREHVGYIDEDTLRLMLDRAESLRRAGGPHYLDVVWEVVDLAKEAKFHSLYALAAAALCKLGPLTDAGMLDGRVVDTVADALERCDDDAARARCAGEATLFFSMGGHAELCRQYFEEALAVARRLDDDALLISALGNAYLVVTHPSEASRRRALANEMLARAERMDDNDARCEALHFVFSVQIQFSDPMIRTSFAQQRLLAQQLGPGRRWMAEYQACCLDYLSGRLDEALTVAAGWLDEAPVSRSRALTAYTMVALVVCLAQGRGQELSDQIDTAIAEHPRMPAWRAIAAFLAAERGDPERVIREFEVIDGGAALPNDMAWAGAVMLLGRALARIGDLERGARLRDLLLPFAGTFAWVGSITVGSFDLALAELAIALGDADEAETHLRSFESCIDRLGAAVYLPDAVRLRRQIEGSP